MAAIGRRNVQEQNEDTRTRIRATSSSFEEQPLRFSWLIELLQARLISPRDGILIELSHVPEQGGELYEGLWLTRQERFFQFSVLVPRTGGEPDVELWRDTTSEITVAACQPGTGKSLGLLALEVLREAPKS